MEEQALQVARTLADHYAQGLGLGIVDGGVLVRAILAGYLAGSGTPSDEAVHMVERMVASNLVGPTPMNPMYQGIPWFVPGPVSGAPYY